MMIYMISSEFNDGFQVTSSLSIRTLGITCNTNDWGAPSHGTISPHCRNDKVNEGTSCSVTCNLGYKVDDNGTSSSVCGSDGTWKPTQTANCVGERIFHAVSKFLTSTLI